MPLCSPSEWLTLREQVMEEDDGVEGSFLSAVRLREPLDGVRKKGWCGKMRLCDKKTPPEGGISAADTPAV